ncbi:hypothetical protein BD408DRAFT_251073 [Parasitella parasitica]|nr:hypothetical protein BD408DRAFT_251073 [Parasitella parasitica]
MPVHASSQYFTNDELEKMDTWFTKKQQLDVFKLAEDCALKPVGRNRRTRIRKRDPNFVGRPPNSFIIFRTEFQAKIRHFCPSANHRDISKILAEWWNADKKGQNAYKSLAKEAKEAHMKR